MIIHTPLVVGSLPVARQPLMHMYNVIQCHINVLIMWVIRGGIRKSTIYTLTYLLNFSIVMYDAAICFFECSVSGECESPMEASPSAPPGSSCGMSSSI